MKQNRSISLVILCLLAVFSLRADNELSDDPASPGGVIINRYLLATQSSSLQNDPQEVDIDASVPQLNQHATLRALRKISNVGKITYRVLGFQGDNTVKNQVIARYLQAEQQAQDDSTIKLTPANYKFKLKGEKSFAGSDVYVFQVSPRAKRMGLFKGEVWLDANTCLPVVEKGRLVRNPSIFFRKVDFERDFNISNGSVVLAHMSSTIDTRIVGKISLNVEYVSPSEDEAENDLSSVSPSSF